MNTASLELCKERMEAFGGQTLGCCCTGHKCKEVGSAPPQVAML